MPSDEERTQFYIQMSEKQFRVTSTVFMEQPTEDIGPEQWMALSIMLGVFCFL